MAEWELNFDRPDGGYDPNAELKRLRGRYHLQYDRPGNTRGSRTFQTESEARRFLDFIGGDPGRVETEQRNRKKPGDPHKTGSWGALDKLAEKARRDASGPKPGERTASGAIQTNAGFTVKANPDGSVADNSGRFGSKSNPDKSNAPAPEDGAPEPPTPEPADGRADVVNMESGPSADDPSTFSIVALIVAALYVVSRVVR